MHVAVEYSGRVSLSRLYRDCFVGQYADVTSSCARLWAPLGIISVKSCNSQIAHPWWLCWSTAPNNNQMVWEVSLWLKLVGPLIAVQSCYPDPDPLNLWIASCIGARLPMQRWSVPRPQWNDGKQYWIIPGNLTSRLLHGLAQPPRQTHFPDRCLWLCKETANLILLVLNPEYSAGTWWSIPSLLMPWASAGVMKTLSNVATDALVLKHQAISTHRAG